MNRKAERAGKGGYTSQGEKRACRHATYVGATPEAEGFETASDLRDITGVGLYRHRPPRISRASLSSSSTAGNKPNSN